MTNLLNHLWQSTLFTVAVALLTLLLRRNSARTRYWLWFAASVKFLIPFSLLVDAGSRLEWRNTSAAAPPAVSFPMEQVFTAPSLVFAAPEAVPHAPNHLRAFLCAVWLCGFFIVLFSWWRQWRRIYLAVQTATPFDIQLPIKTMSSPGLLEPGVFGIFRPVLLLPEGITERLMLDQLEAIVAHELCHVRSYDNLAAAVHMLAEAIFWFHPLLWWIGKRLVDERERACDEEVLRLGSKPQVYAESILKVCRLYLESPLDCVSGITGSDLRKRIRGIMTLRVAQRLNAGRKVLLAAAGVAAVMAPIMVGVLNAPRVRAQASPERPQFEVASVKPSAGGAGMSIGSDRAGGLNTRNTPLLALIAQAYGVRSFQIYGAPGWISSAAYDITAKREVNPKDVQGKKESYETRWADIMLRLQVLLEDRCSLKVHSETKQLPVYALTVAKSGLKLQAPDCVTVDPDHPATPPAPGQPPPTYCGTFRTGRNGLNSTFTGSGITIEGLTGWLSGTTGRTVINRTGYTKEFNATMEWTPDAALNPPSTGNETPADATGPSIFTALQEQVGLKLESTKGPVEVLVIDHVERPSGNDQAFFRKVLWTPQTFEVASVRPSGPSDGGKKSADGEARGANFGLEHRRLNVRLNLYGLIVNAYGLRGCPPFGESGGCTLLSGGPDWLRKDQFEIVAKMPDDSPDYTSVQFVNGHAPQLQLMLQALLADRFHLAVHRETKEAPVYALTIAKRGPMFKKADGAEESKVFFHPSVQSNGQEIIQLVVKNSSMQEVVDLYAKFMDRPVVDRTGLKGKYDFTMDYEADADALGPFAKLIGPGLFRAFEEQAGLKLEATKGPVEVLVIDHAEKPSEN